MPSRLAALLFSLALVAVTGIALLTVTAQPATASSSYRQAIDITFPVVGTTRYIRDYDFCRSGCSRRHRATDIMAPYGVNVHAAMGGTITFITGMNNNPPHYGYMIRIAGDDGRTYNYIHLGRQNGTASEAYAPGMRRGVRVERGQHIGFNGCSGNASCSAPHLHFEIVDPRVRDPYGGNRMDPYNSLRAAEARGDYPGATAPRVLASETDSCYALTGDWDGTGRDGIGWWCDGTARLRTASGEVIEYRVGREGDVPVAGDFAGTGVDRVSVVRDDQWHLVLNGSGDTSERFRFGRVSQGDVPIAGDWLGLGFDQIGIIRDGDWHLRFDLSGGAADRSFTYGRLTRGDRQLIGDWGGLGFDAVGIVREVERNGRAVGEWHLRTSHSGGPGEIVYVYGRVSSGDLPAMGDWNGDGQDTPAIVRGDEWHLRYEHAGGAADEVIVFARPNG